MKRVGSEIRSVMMGMVLLSALFSSCKKEEPVFSPAVIPSDAKYELLSFTPEAGCTYGFTQGDLKGTLLVTGVDVRELNGDSIRTLYFMMDDRPYRFTMDDHRYFCFSNRYLDNVYGAMRYWDAKAEPESVLFTFTRPGVISSGHPWGAEKTYFTKGYR